MRKSLFAFGVLIATTSTAQAAEVTAEGGFITGYLDDNNQEYSDLSFQGSIEVEVGEGWTFSTWVNHGKDAEGGELDLTVKKEIAVSKEVTIEVEVGRYILRESPDINLASATMTYGAVDVSVSYYNWKLEDTLRVSAGYTIPVNEKLTARPQVTYETKGFGARSVTAGVGAEYALNDTFSLRGLALYDGKNVRGSLGLFAAF